MATLTATSFNPRSPCGERRSCVSTSDSRSSVSTHAPLAGSDPASASMGSVLSCFNPRSPCGERPGGVSLLARDKVSTHAPLAGSDVTVKASLYLPPGFNPRSPCGERLLHLVNVALRAYHMHDVFHPNASSDELRPSETNQKAVRTSQGIPDSPQFAPPIIPTAYS